MHRKYIIIAGLVLALLILVRIASGPFEKLEQGLLDVRYHVRGQVPADTNVVILYFDNDDISSLGGGTLKRSYYALLIDVLSKYHVAAIGLEPFFGEQSLEYPEQDELLASTAAASGNVVFSSYFRIVEPNPPSHASSAVVEYPAYEKNPEPILYGSQLQIPFPSLLQSAAGIGHTNNMEGAPSQVPLLISSEAKSVPTLALEVLRVFTHADRTDVRIQHRSVTIPTKGKTVRIPFESDGTTFLNFPGSLSSFRHYRCVEVMYSYQRQALGLPATIDLSSLENKIVLVSIIGEGRGRFFQTPFDAQFPSVGIQATFLDNALEDGFLSKPQAWVGAWFIPLGLNIIVILLIHRFGIFRGGIFAVLLTVLYLSVVQLFFVSSHILLPIAVPLIFLAAAWLMPALYDYFLVGKHVAQLESEKERVEGRLRESELKLQMLEKELLSEKAPDDRSARASELLEEIKRYKEEVRTLSAQVSDMVRFEEPEIETRPEVATFQGIVFQKSGRMKEVTDLIQMISTSDTNVLILGESGTGKELVARAVHDLSSRKGKAFVAVNCGALTETLLESELFGHERGSFTGAVKDKVGRFEYADGGTIFLDEIGETSEAFQVKLLRIVQTGEFERVGSTISRKTDARIIAATNKNLRDLVAAKRFREDLYYRLNVFSIELPPLRERKGDITLLAEHFLKHEEGSLSLSATVADAFLQYHWPGNVRELQSAITRAGILSRSDGRTLIQLRDVSDEIAAASKGRIDIEDQILEILRSKKFSRSSISETAETLGGLNRGTVAEYFRGICFKHFFENSWDEAKAVDAIAKDGDVESREKVQKKLHEYLANVVEGIVTGQEYDDIRKSLRPKYKNLPQRYHTILDEVIRAFIQGKWK
jgi:DNA-binding NtrC family response regulator/CHASE2 domain-containing sensor protein